MWIAATQSVFLAAVLAWSGQHKVIGDAGRRSVGRTALPRLFGERRALPVFLTVGVVELVLALALLAVPGPAAPAATGLLAVGFLGYLGFAVRKAPQSSCGCVAATRTPVNWRGFARAWFMLVAAVVAAVGSDAWWSAFRPASAALLVVELAVLVTLSAELDRFWLVPLRRLRVRLTHPLAGAPDTVPLHATMVQLQRSDAFKRVAPLLTSDVREHWDADEWRILTYAARHQDRPATAVFAVPLDRDDPAAVRVSIVDEEAALLPG